MFNSDDITNKSNKKHNKKGPLFQITHTEFRQLEVKDQEKQMYYLI